MSKQNCIIVDIDGTVSDLSHSLHMIKVKPRGEEAPIDYDLFNAACVDDEPIKPIINLVKSYLKANRGTELFFCTGRSMKCSEQTIWWLKKYFPSFNWHLLMRDEFDKRSDFLVKKDLHKDHILTKGYCVDFVIDDRDRVVKMWRDIGLICIQPKEGDY